jgi:uncharacterized protein (UPF0276 family)
MAATAMGTVMATATATPTLVVRPVAPLDVPLLTRAVTPGARRGVRLGARRRTQGPDMKSPRGFGIGLRRDHFGALAFDDARSPLLAVDFVEIIPENYAARGGRARAVLDEVRARMPVLAHGVSLSLGGPAPLDVAWLRTLKVLLDELCVPFFTEHLSFTSTEAVAFHELLPLPFTDEAVRHVARRTRQASEILERDILLENPSALVRMPGSLDEGSFTRAVLEESGAFLLFDVNNVFVTAHNTGEDVTALFDAFPLDRVRQIHVAGHQRIEGALVDTHMGPVPEGVTALLARAARLCPDVPVLLEWDTHIPALEVVLDEAARLRAIVDTARLPATTGLSVRGAHETPLSLGAP